jgi:predicted aspartyl protease
MKRTFFVLLVLVLLPAGGAALAATASFDVDSGRPIVQLTVNGKGPYPFVFDTGSPALLVSQSLVDELGLEVVGKDEVGSPLGGTPVEVDVVRVDSIALGGAAVGGLKAMVLDMGGHGLGKGIVGPVLFREHGPITMDFKSNTIALGDDASAAGIESWLPFGDSAPLLDILVRIGDVVIDGHVDTGNPDVLAVPTRFEESLPLSGPVRTISRARTVDAEFDIRSAPIDASARIGGVEIPLQEVRLAELPVANLGTAGLRGLQLHIDWDEERFALTGTSEPGTGPGPRRMVRQVSGGDGPRFGLRAMPSPDGSIQVAGTDPGSAAEAIGLLAGDRVIAVNGKPTRDLEHAQIRTELARADLELTIERDGEKLQLK